MRALGETENFGNELIRVECSVAAPAQSPLLETRGERENVRNHGRILRLGIYVQKDGVCSIIGCIHQRLNHVGSGNGDGEVVGRTTTIGNAS